MELYTHVDTGQLRREAAARPIHKVDAIDVWRLEPSFLDALERAVGRTTHLEIVRTEGQLYVTVGGRVIEAALGRVRLVGD